MGIYIKLTDQQGRTFNGYQWGGPPGTVHRAKERGHELCTGQVLHGYRTILLAVLLNPARSNIQSPLGWTFTGRPVVDDGTQLGFKTQVVGEPIDLPVLSVSQKVAFGILVAQTVVPILDMAWHKWADDWLNANDRTAVTAKARAVGAETMEAALVAKTMVTKAMVKATIVAEAMVAAAARAAAEAVVTEATEVEVAWAATWTEWAALNTMKPDLQKLAEKALLY